MYVLIIVSTMTIICVATIKKTQQSRKMNTLIQEMMILRNAFMAYYEADGNFPDIELASLSDDTFSQLKPYWYPFNPSNSNVMEGKSSWAASTSTTVKDTYLRLNTTEDLGLQQDDISTTTHNLCKVVVGDDGTTCDFYIIKAFDAE